jgi:hypothetical protein
MHASEYTKAVVEAQHKLEEKGKEVARLQVCDEYIFCMCRSINKDLRPDGETVG